MRTFVLRSRIGPTRPEEVDRSVGPPHHLEIAAHSFVSAMLVSKDIRRDVRFHLVLEGGRDAPKVVTFDSNAIEYIGGFHEEAFAEAVKKALAASRGVRKEDPVSTEKGIQVRRQSFEKLVHSLCERQAVYMLDKKGDDVRTVELPENCAFLFTDHIPMQKKTFKLLDRIGVRKISLGPKMLFAAHCITLVQNELDRRYRH